MQAVEVVPPVTQHAGSTGDALVRWAIGAGLAALWLPTLWDISAGIWAADAQGHELLFVAVSGFLLYGKRQLLVRREGTAVHLLPLGLFMAGLLMYVVGRSQQFLRIELLSLLTVTGALIALAGGRAALKAAAFPLFFLLFIVPLPYSWVLAVTGPLKLAVSAVATTLLSWVGMPVARSGVVVTIGQYQLLVSEACAGLQTMFTLEAVGLLYVNLRCAGSAARSIALTLAVPPISFAANVVRVIVLMLVTYGFGDAVGQGFVHGFAGLVLFGAALAMLMALDGLLLHRASRRPAMK
jgi:exosortase B